MKSDSERLAYAREVLTQIVLDAGGGSREAEMALWKIRDMSPDSGMTPDEAVKYLNERLPHCGWMIAKGRVGIEPLFAIQIYEKTDYMPWEEPVAIARAEGNDFATMVQHAASAALQPKE